MASLVVLTGPRKGLHLDLRGERTVLGREGDCDIAIDDKFRGPTAPRKDSVSRKHAIISRVGDEYYLEDGNGKGKKSRNGTLLNDREVPFPNKVPLRDNDIISICDLRFQFLEEEESSFTVKATLDHESSVHSLQAQPAEKLQVILEISNSLSTALEMDSLLPRMVENLLRLFRQADRGFIILRDEVTESLAVRAFKGRIGTESDTRFSASVVRDCLEKVQAILGNDPLVQFPESDSVSELPVRSLMCAPLWSPEGQALGAIQLDTSSAKSQFTQGDLNLLLGVASQASIALCNARMHQEALVHQQHERDMELAREVQRALLPRFLPNIPGYEFAACYEPARQIGGDYYDFVPLPENRLAILLGDVSGKGVAAALVMAKFSVEVRVCLESEPDLAAALNRLNVMMTRADLKERFVTLAAVVLDPATHQATVVNAGHPSPLLVRHATGEIGEVAPSEFAGLPIGVIEGHTYGSRTFELLPGDKLLLFSDGVTDARDLQGHYFRPRGIRAVLKHSPESPCETGEKLIQTLKKHATGCSQMDDITLVCFARAVH